jgi:hypothetical protein
MLWPQDGEERSARSNNALHRSERCFIALDWSDTLRPSTIRSLSQTVIEAVPGSLKPFPPAI